MWVIEDIFESYLRDFFSVDWQKKSPVNMLFIIIIIIVVVIIIIIIVVVIELL